MNRIHSTKKPSGLCARWFALMFFLSLASTGFAQIQLLKGGNMETDTTSWKIYHLGITPKSVYKFNYTAQKPTQGTGGCLRITSQQKSTILFWQKFTVKAGESFTVDGAIKTNNVASFWAEIYVSTIPPIEGADYSPNNNTDVVLGFSTWAGCGSNVNGTFNLNACTGKRTYVVPGTAGTNVDIYFAFKTGSMAAPFPNPLEVLVDNFKLTRAANTGNSITSMSFGSISTSSITVPGNVVASQLRSAIAVSPYATFKILNSSNAEVSNLTTVVNTMKVVVTAENGVAKTYTITTTAPAITPETLNNFTGTVASYVNKNLTISGNSQLTITGSDNPLKGSQLNLTSDNIWLSFPTIKPSVFAARYLSQLMINGAAAVLDQNIRIEQHLLGTMVISQPSTYKALQVYSGENLGATSLQLGNYTYHRSGQLGGLNNAIKSFRLKKGYMATFAQNDDGTGFSQVYVADNADVVINKLPAKLYNQASFVRVIPWRWTAKKGWTNGRDGAQALNCLWQYDWNNEATSDLDIEYVPMRHNLGWNSYENINNKVKSTHALGFNEPDRPDQANISVDSAIAAWPEMLKSGLRLGSPCPSDASAGLGWLYEFIDRCDALNYRVDFVAVHWYKGGQTARQFYDWLKAIHVRTKRPIWITEWNNGANWTCCKPTYAQNAQAISEMTNMMDTTSFVERYSLYEWVQDTRQMFYQWATTFTPAGVVYRDNASPMAYNPNKAYVPARMAPVMTEVKGAPIQLYPNPGENTITIENGGKSGTVSIYTATGTLVQTSELTENNTINVASLPTGAYIIQVSNGKAVTRQKFIKK